MHTAYVICADDAVQRRRISKSIFKYAYNTNTREKRVWSLSVSRFTRVWYDSNFKLRFKRAQSSRCEVAVRGVRSRPPLRLITIWLRIKSRYKVLKMTNMRHQITDSKFFKSFVLWPISFLFFAYGLSYRVGYFYVSMSAEEPLIKRREGFCIHT